jgi:hypothetical protein
MTRHHLMYSHIHVLKARYRRARVVHLVTWFHRHQVTPRHFSLMAVLCIIRNPAMPSSGKSKTHSVYGRDSWPITMQTTGKRQSIHTHSIYRELLYVSSTFQKRYRYIALRIVCEIYASGMADFTPRLGERLAGAYWELIRSVQFPLRNGGFLTAKGFYEFIQIPLSDGIWPFDLLEILPRSRLRMPFLEFKWTLYLKYHFKVIQPASYHSKRIFSVQSKW